MPQSGRRIGRGGMSAPRYKDEYHLFPHVQALYFLKDAWTRKSSKAWAKKHGFKYGTMDYSTNYWILPQRPPEHFLDRIQGGRVRPFIITAKPFSMEDDAQLINARVGVLKTQYKPKYKNNPTDKEKFLMFFLNEGQKITADHIKNYYTELKSPELLDYVLNMSERLEEQLGEPLLYHLDYVRSMPVSLDEGYDLGLMIFKFSDQYFKANDKLFNSFAISHPDFKKAKTMSQIMISAITFAVEEDKKS